MLRYGTYDDGDDKLQQVDLLYIPPKSNENPCEIPRVEHGYLWDRDDLVQDMDCASFVRGCNVPLKESELVKSVDIYNLPAEFVEFIFPIQVLQKEAEMIGSKDEFF